MSTRILLLERPQVEPIAGRPALLSIITNNVAMVRRGDARGHGDPFLRVSHLGKGDLVLPVRKKK